MPRAILGTRAIGSSALVWTKEIFVVVFHFHPLLVQSFGNLVPPSLVTGKLYNSPGWLIVYVTCCRNMYIYYIHTHAHARTYAKFKAFRCPCFSSLPKRIIHLQEVYYSWLHSIWAINMFWWSDVRRVLQHAHALYCLASRTYTFKVSDWRKFYK